MEDTNCGAVDNSYGEFFGLSDFIFCGAEGHSGNTNWEPADQRGDEVCMGVPLLCPLDNGLVVTDA